MAILAMDTVDRTHFAGRHPADRNFYLLFVVLCWLGVINGFIGATMGRLAGEADYVAPLILHIHAVSFLAWLTLLTSQMLLIRRGNVALHRRMGRAGMVLVPVMALSGFFAEVYSQRFYFDHPPNSQAFFIIPIWYVLGFAVLGTWAFRARREPPAHKRLIVLATTLIVGAAYARWWGEAIKGVVGDGYAGMWIHSYTGTALLLALVWWHDWRSRGAIHPVVKKGTAFILAGSLLTTVIYHSPGWLPVARMLIGR